MKQLLTKAILGATLVATGLTAAAPADAQRYRGGHSGYGYGYGGYGHRGGNGGAYLAAGVAGLAIGAVLASNNGGYRDRWYRDNGYSYNYDDYYYRQRGYYPNNGYYAYQSRNYGHCYTEKRYDPYYGRRVRIQVCN